MKFEPISEADAANANLRKAGLYDFEVLESKDRISKKENQMIELNVKLYDTEGRTFRLFDYLVSAEGMAYKIRHYASATGQLAQYEKGELRALDQVGKTGRCQVGIQKAKDGYPAKNIISDYAPTVPGAPLIESVKDMDDEIPF